MATTQSDHGAQGESAISIRSLSKSYGPIRALDAATMEVPEGMVYGLVGPNGSGKSTLIKAICGILRPDSGSIGVLGMDASRDRHRIRKKLGYMPQTPSLYEDLSPVENMRFFGGARKGGDMDGQIREKLELVGLWGRRNDSLFTFSGGMRQRASLACALMHDPQLLILDEPTAGVDPILKQDFWEHFRDICEHGRTIFLSTNMMDEAMRCHRVAVILGGAILIAETPEAIRGRGRARVTLRLEGGVRTEEMADYESGLPRLLAEYGLAPEVRGIDIRRQSLEDVILTMINSDDSGHAETGGGGRR